MLNVKTCKCFFFLLFVCLFVSIILRFQPFTDMPAIVLVDVQIMPKYVQVQWAQFYTRITLFPVQLECYHCRVFLRPALKHIFIAYIKYIPTNSCNRVIGWIQSPSVELTEEALLPLSETAEYSAARARGLHGTV